MTSSRPPRPPAPRPEAARPTRPRRSASSRPAERGAAGPQERGTPAPGDGKDDVPRVAARAEISPEILPPPGPPTAGGAPRSFAPARVVAPDDVAPPAVRGSIRTAPVVSPTSAARFAERARARRTLARRQVIGLSVCAALVAGIGWLLLGSPVLALDAATVRVDGAGTVVAVDAVRAVVDERDGTPLPRLDTGALRADLLDVPGVREATVTRDWPHGLTVTLVAREPVAAVPADGRSGYSLLDQDGVQVGHVAKAPAELPVVDVPVGDRRTLRGVLTVVEQLDPDLLAQVGGVSARTQDTISMKLRKGARIAWGSAAETHLKAAVLTALLDSEQGRKAKVIDVSAPRMPIIK